jgi:predicted ATPase
MPDEAEPRARIVEVGGRSQALGGSVMLRLAEPFTVLVGRNAAGKSALLHLITKSARQAGTPSLIPDQVDEFQCTAEIGGQAYRYTASVAIVPAELEVDVDFVWREECVALASGRGKLWSTDAGTVSGLASRIIVPPYAGLLALDPSKLPDEIRPVAAAFGRLFRHVTFVPAGLPATVDRPPMFFVRGSATGIFDLRGGRSPRFDRFALQLVRWHQSNDERFERVHSILRRIGICETLDFVVSAVGPDTAVGFLLIDGFDLGVASDGTLRVIEIVVALELAAAGALVMIEEPETGIHPGLSDRIMAEIESAAEGLQLIISTHSPRILDRVQYHQLRHIRRNGSTRIDALTPEQVKAVKAFLDHDGTLSDYVFSPDFTAEDDEIEAG